MIKIIRGVYGHLVNGRVYPKDCNSEPFALTPAQEKRLVSEGFAEYVDCKMYETEPELPELPDGVDAIPEYNVNMKADELREIGKIMGLTFNNRMTKAEMVAEMDAFINEHMEESEEDADIPPEDYEEAPTFDAAEAVQ